MYTVCKSHQPPLQFIVNLFDYFVLQKGNTSRTTSFFKKRLTKYIPQTDPKLVPFNFVKVMDFREALSEIKWGLRMCVKQLSDEGSHLCIALPLLRFVYVSCLSLWKKVLHIFHCMIRDRITGTAEHYLQLLWGFPIRINILDFA